VPLAVGKNDGVSRVRGDQQVMFGKSHRGTRACGANGFIGAVRSGMV
jgi:hypothetical protein